MKLELVALSGLKYSDDAYEVVIPTAEGQISVYPGHMPLVALAVPGVLTVRRQKGDSDDDRDFYATVGGIVEISADTVRVLVDELEHAEELYDEEVLEAYERAQQMKSEAKNSIDLEKAQALVDRQAVRLRVADLKRQRRPRRPQQ